MPPSGCILPASLLRNALLLLLFSLASQCFPHPASASIMIFDDVIPVNKSLKLRAVTRGMFFPEGGRLVTYYAGDKKIGTTLSGGDGYAYLKYTPHAPGIVPFKVTSGEDTDEGTVLVTGRKESVIIIEIEGTLFDSVLSFRPVENAPDIMAKIPEGIRILYATTLAGIAPSRKWLKENRFPPSPVMQWGGGAMIADLQERGITIYGIVASPERLSEVTNIERRFSFQETDTGRVVKDWDDLMKRLKEKKGK